MLQIPIREWTVISMSAIDSDLQLEIMHLKTFFNTDDGIAYAVNGVDLRIHRGETLGIVGESGCGKSVTALSIMQLLPSASGYIADGKILLHRKDGHIVDIAQLNPHGAELRSIRGNDIAMIFQEPMRSLSPVYTIGNQITEAIRLHQKLDKSEARHLAVEMLDKVGIANPSTRIDEYPHQMSGGMRQRVMIAMALSCKPRLLIADEPSTSLDVTIQAQILELMSQLQEEFNMALMMITHDLGVIAEIADRVAVMYLGRVVETAPVVELFYNPRHPYTHALLQSIPTRTRRDAGRRRRLKTIEGTVPDALALPPGCAFASRCPFVQRVCLDHVPPLEEVGFDHSAACIFASELELTGVG
jgi:peptide/nickel transport system ATP-binding protein